MEKNPNKDRKKNKSRPHIHTARHNKCMFPTAFPIRLNHSVFTVPRTNLLSHTTPAFLALRAVIYIAFHKEQFKWKINFLIEGVKAFAWHDFHSRFGGICLSLSLFSYRARGIIPVAVAARTSDTVCPASTAIHYSNTMYASPLNRSSISGVRHCWNHMAIQQERRLWYRKCSDIHSHSYTSERAFADDDDSSPNNDISSNNINNVQIHSHPNVNIYDS